MKKLFLLAVLGCLLTNISTAQDAPAESSSLLEKSQLRLNVVPLNVAYEHRIGDKSTIYVQAGLGFGSYKNADDTTGGFWSGLTNRTWGLGLNVNAQYRYFYNLEKRQAKSRNIASNSGNYVGGQITPLLPPIYKFGDKEVVSENGVILGAMWGMQRAKKDLLIFHFNIGPALRISNEGTSTSLQTQLAVGFILGD